ncbi:MAG: VCBS repeat-containing protein [Planctomycetota bacterium]|nr:VCBS repeat-containing protein [Planctomycetota bacterium]
MTDQPVNPDDRRVMYVVGAGLVLACLVFGILFLLGVDEGTAPPAPRGAARGPTPDRGEVPAVPYAARFTDVASDSGVQRIQKSGAAGEYLLPETMGSGVALGDLDGDGDPDLLLLSVGGRPGLYRNDTRPGEGIRFAEVTAGTPLAAIEGSTTSAFADVNGDGLLDVVVGTVGSDRLFLNRGDLEFEETARLGDSWTSAMGFLDVDGDDDQDLVVASYVKWSPRIDLEVDFTLDGIGRAYGPPTGFPATDLELYINDGAGGFAAEGASRGLSIRRADRAVPVMKALGLAFEDVDLDGAPDILVANDTTPNRLLINDGNGSFHEAAAEYGFAYDIDGNSTGAMGIDVLRDPGSGRLICAIGNFANEPSSLFVQGSTGGFLDQSSLSGVGAPTRNALTFGTLLIDFDLDGRIDLLQINGHIEPRIELVQSGQRYEQTAQLFRGTSELGRFNLVDGPLLGDLDIPIAGRAAASADLDGDGDHDLVVSAIDRIPLVLRNDLDPDPESVIRVMVRGTAGSPQGAGAVIEVLSEAGRVLHRTRLDRTRSYLAQSELLGLFPRSLPEPAKRVRVRFPDGIIRTVEVPEDGHVEVRHDGPGVSSSPERSM